jgi:hypothetical protein
VRQNSLGKRQARRDCRRHGTRGKQLKNVFGNSQPFFRETIVHVDAEGPHRDTSIQIGTKIIEEVRIW